MLRLSGKTVLWTGIWIPLCLKAGALPPPYPIQFQTGTESEKSFLVRERGAGATAGVRQAGPGQFWVYAFPAAPGVQCRLTFLLDADSAAPTVLVRGPDNKPLPTRTIRENPGSFSVLWDTPLTWPHGGRATVQIGAKAGRVKVRAAQYTQMEPDRNNDGLPDSIAAFLTQGLPPATKVVVTPAPSAPLTSTQTPLPITPALDLQTDAVFVYHTDASVIRSWKERGYTVWTMGGAREGREYATRNPGEVQTTAEGTQLNIGGSSFYLAPTANRIQIEREFYRRALDNGSSGICPEEPEYFLKAGYEDAFRQAWQRVYSAPWQPPHSSVDARWRAARLMATLQTEHIAALLADAQQRYPDARRMVALHSPLSYAHWGIVCPHYRITGLPTVQEVIGQVWTGTARTPARYAGLSADRTFAVAYLEYSSLYQLLRGTGKRLWFLMDPVEDDPNRSMADYRDHYERTLIAALMFPEVTAFEVMPWPERVYGRIPPDYATEVNSVIAALQDMHAQTAPVTGSLPGDIGVLISDSMQWQREPPFASDFDGVFGLTLPLLHRGVPVQLVSLDRAGDPGYLRPFKTLLLSYDFQKPPDGRTQSVLASWVRDGGSLIFLGGADPYNAVRDAWWRVAGRTDPQSDLWEKLGIRVGAATTHMPPQEDRSRYTVLLQGDGKERNLANRRTYTLDLTPYVARTGSVAVRFEDVSPEDGWGPYVASVELRVGDRIATAFQAGSELENRFLAYDRGSQFNGVARFADQNASWTYQFDNLPRDQKVTLTVDMGNGFRVSAAPAQPEAGMTLLSASDNELTRALPRLRAGNYPVTIYPFTGQKPDENPTPLYNLRAGGTAIWTQTVGRGLVLYVGVAPGFFSASERSAGLLRALTQYAHQRAGGTYAEPGSLKVRRGRYTIVRTLHVAETIEGRTIDVLAPNLSVEKDRTIPPRSHALLVDMPSGPVPRIGFVSGRLRARVETRTTTGLFVCGPANTPGAARLYAAGKSLAGLKATDRFGRTVPVQVTPEGDSVLLQYPHLPDGVLIRVGWN